MYRAFISSAGNCVIEPLVFVFTPGKVPAKRIIAFCRHDDDQFGTFVQFCKDEGWML